MTAAELDAGAWADILDHYDEPALATVADGLAAAYGLDPNRAYDAVVDAIGDGVLVEDDDGAVRLADDVETPKTAKNGDTYTRGGRSEPSDPQGNDAETGEDLEKYRRVYLDAAERADREHWEPVEEEAIREALDAIGFEHLLDRGELRQVSGWSVADLSDTDEEPRRRWYYPSGDEPDTAEFRRFDELLTEAAPDEYVPHYFRVARASKDPATQYGSWKTDDARLSVEEAVEWIRDGGNVGIAGRPEDPLVNVDIDDDEATTPDDVPTSLRARSRSRTGWHTWYFNPDGDVPNIPTDKYGEVRTDWQYVVAPGSFVASCREEIPEGADRPGYYTVEDEEPVASVEYDDLPQVFRDVAEAIAEAEEAAEDDDELATPDLDHDDDRDGSDVYDVEAADLISGSKDASARFSSIFHDSATGANMSVSNDKVHCWRHGVAHGGLQALATLSTVEHVRTYGCRDLGAAHKNSGAGSNSLKGDWRLVWGAWHEAKNQRAIPDDDPIPYRVLRELSVADGLVNEDEVVERDADTGAIADDDSEDTYRALPSGTYNDALEHVRDTYDVDPGREPVDTRTDTQEDAEEYGTDPREVSATVDVRRAWEAAGRVEPEEVDSDALEASDGDAFGCPGCGDPVDVVRAVAVEEGLAECCEGPLGDAYPTAYGIARTEYGAPLPEYYTTADAIAEFDAVLDVVRELTFWDLDTDALATEITATGDDVGGEAVRALDPDGVWRDSDSGESVLVYEAGNIWDADPPSGSVDVLRFCALDAGIIDDPGDPLKGSDYTDAYRVARTEYGAPLPRWEPALDGAREVTPQLPPSEDLVDARDVDGVDPDALEVARDDVEALIDAATCSLKDDRCPFTTVAKADTPTVVTALPATGKTTGTIKTARDRPLSYLAPRKELQKQALDKADRWGVSAEILPVFSEANPRDDVLGAALSHVREHSKRRLRDRWAVLSDVLGDEDVDDVDASDIFTEDDGDEPDRDEVELDRPTCETAEGDHGAAWALAVHVAYQLGHNPREIHTQARGLFGAPLPCTEGGECEYGVGWDAVTDAEAPPDLLVGSYGHCNVESVRTHYSEDGLGRINREPRAVVLDEFVGEAFTREFGDEAADHATWLARCLSDDVDDYRDMLEADLGADPFVTEWLDGRDTDGEATAALDRVGDLYDAREGAAEILEEVDADALDALGLGDALEAVVDTGRDPGLALDTLEYAIGAVSADDDGRSVADWADETVREPLEDATGGGRLDPTVDPVDTDELGIGGDLELLVEDAVEAVRDGRDGARQTIEAAVEALRGGREGCRRLAAWGRDGYAHPDACHILAAVVADDEDTDRIHTSSWAFDPQATDGSVVDVVDTGDEARTVLDRNGHGALIHSPPSRTSGSGDPAPLVGLDATGRRELWRNALGEDVTIADIHDSDAERAAFLEDVLDLRVLQAADGPRAYSGDPMTKDTDGDVALLEAIADEYAGLQAPRRRGDDAVAIGKPAAITTRDVRTVLESDRRLDDVVAEWENYGNLTGDNQLGDHRLAAILGSQHYGDDAIERFCAIAGEAVDTDRDGRRGAELEYGSDLADAYLGHMREDQTMQAALRFTRGGSGATVVARTSALREDLPVVGRGQVVETWSETATAIARRYRGLQAEFTVSDVADAVDVKKRQVRRVLGELVEAGYVQRVEAGAGVATVYEATSTPGAGEVDLPDRVTAEPGHSAHDQYYTHNVRVYGGESAPDTARDAPPVRQRGAPPSPTAVDAPPGD